LWLHFPIPDVSGTEDDENSTERSGTIHGHIDPALQPPTHRHFHAIPGACNPHHQQWRLRTHGQGGHGCGAGHPRRHLRLQLLHGQLQGREWRCLLRCRDYYRAVESFFRRLWSG